MTGPMVFAILALCFVLPAQNPRLNGGGAKTWMVVPMIGAGTYSDPRRPAFVREAGVPFQMQLSDDGTMALVEVTGRTPLELKRLEDRVKTDARARVFQAGKDTLSGVVTEFRKYKRDFDPESFGVPAAFRPPAQKQN
jgi:hypothetical protein